MTSERAQSYGRVTRLLDEVGATKLQPSEQASVREAADALFFSEGDAGARAAMAEAEALVDRLVASERWTRERADDLLDAIAGCGPATVRA